MVNRGGSDGVVRIGGPSSNVFRFVAGQVLRMDYSLITCNNLNNILSLTFPLLLKC